MMWLNTGSMHTHTSGCVYTHTDRNTPTHTLIIMYPKWRAKC